MSRTMKYTHCLVLAYMLLIASRAASADTQGYYTYTTNATGQATITAFDRGYSGTLVMTNALGGCPVTAIGADAFADCVFLTNVTIPDGVATIGNYAFFNCRSLSSIMISTSVTHIGDHAFHSCVSLPSITISTGVTHIGNYAFFNCISLTSVTISDSIIHIGEWTFSNCSSLSSVNIFGSFTHISDYAFAYSSNLKSIYCAGNPPVIEFTDLDVFSETEATLYYLPAFVSIWPSTLGGRPTKLWDPVFSDTTLTDGQVLLTVTGTPTIPIAFEATTNLNSSTWVRLCTTNLINNAVLLRDLTATNYPARFYRIVGP